MTLPAPDHPITGTIDAIEDNSVRIYTGPYAWSYDVISREQFEIWLRQDERNAGLFTRQEKETPAPEITSEPVTVYPVSYTHLRMRSCARPSAREPVS